MIGNVFIYFILIITIIYTKALAQEVQEAVDEWALVDIEMAQAKEPLDDCVNYLVKKGWEEHRQIKKNDGSGTTFLVGCGSNISFADAGSDDFMVSRQNAITNAILDGKKKYSEFRAQELSTNTIDMAQQGTKEESQTDIEKKQEAETKNDLGILEKLKLIANSKVDKKLKEEGINPEEEAEKKKELVEEIVASSSFQRAIKSATSLEEAGFQVFKLWEDCKLGEQCKIAVLIMRSSAQATIAKGILNPGLNPVQRKKPGKPLPKGEMWNSKKVLGNIGARIKVDENGDYHILSTAISVPMDENRTSLSIARDDAVLQADGFIRDFAGTFVASSSESIKKEIENVDNQGNRDVSMEKYFKKVSSQVASPEFISGITTLATGKARHPSSPKWAYFAVRKWSFNSQAEALKPIDAEVGSSNNTSSSPASSSTLESEEADF